MNGDAIRKRTADNVERIMRAPAPAAATQAKHLHILNARVTLIAEQTLLLGEIAAILADAHRNSVAMVQVADAARAFVYGDDCTDDAVEMHGTQSHSAPVAYMEFYTRVREIDGKPIEGVIAERAAAYEADVVQEALAKGGA